MFGALACLVVWRLWVARRHLRDVFLKAIQNPIPQTIPQRFCPIARWCACFALSLAYVLFWLCRIGMDVATALVFLGALSVIYIGLARVVSEAGMVYSGATVTPQAFVMDMRGTEVMSAGSLTGIALSYAIVDYMRGLFTPGVAQSIKMGELIRGNRRALLFWAGISVLLGLAASVFYTLHLGYAYGAYNFPRFPFFSGDPKGIYGSTLTMMHTPQAPDSERVVFFALARV